MARVTKGKVGPDVSLEQGRLSTNALGLWSLVIMGIAYMGLALTAYFNFGIMEGLTGPVVPLAFAAVTVAMLPTALSYAAHEQPAPFDRRHPHVAVGGNQPSTRRLAGLGTCHRLYRRLHPAARHVRAVLQLVPEFLQRPHEYLDRHGGRVDPPMAEETKTPRSLVPRATIYVTIGAGLYWVVTSFGIVNSVPSSTMAGYVISGQFTPIYLVAGHYVSWLRILVPLTGFTAVFAAFSAISIAASRQLYALGREGLTPRVFAKTDKNQTPWNAELFVLGCCVVLPVLIILYQQRNPLLAFGWIGEAYVFFILIPYTLTCVANILYHRRFHRADFNMLTNLILPVLGIAINIYIFYKNFFQTFVLHPTSFTLQISITVACFAAILLAVVLTVVGIKRTGKLGRPHGFVEDEPEVLAAEGGA